MGAPTSIDVVPATPERWPDVQRFFAATSGCWCQRFMASAPREPSAALRDQLSDAIEPPALLALVDGEPAGWTRVMPRDQVPGVSANRALRRILRPDPQAYWVTCLVVRRGFRGSGLGTELLAAAVRLARAQGASAVEGHPVDVSRLTVARPSPAALFTGTVSMFRALGFEEVGRTSVSRPVMRLTIG